MPWKDFQPPALRFPTTYSDGWKGYIWKVFKIPLFFFIHLKFCNGLTFAAENTMTMFSSPSFTRPWQRRNLSKSIIWNIWSTFTPPHHRTLPFFRPFIFPFNRTPLIHFCNHILCPSFIISFALSSHIQFSSYSLISLLLLSPFHPPFHHSLSLKFNLPYETLISLYPSSLCSPSPQNQYIHITSVHRFLLEFDAFGSRTRKHKHSYRINRKVSTKKEYRNCSESN